ncbi:MAG TPA: universal stress protein [Terriglobales bacterium]|nr:universal stress protein [Terriglobales bacterium]
MQVVDSKTQIALKNILFATDFSTCSETALHYAAAMARRYGSKLHVTHVLLPEAFLMAPPEGYVLGPPRAPISYDKVRAQAEADMAVLSQSPLLSGIRFETILGEGEVSAVLWKVMQERDIDLIVLGTHGRKGFERLILGSVAESVFRTSPCPVLTVGPKVCTEPPTQFALKNILFATDLSGGAEQVIPYAVSLAQEFHAHLLLLHVEPNGKTFSFDRYMAEEVGQKRLLEMVPQCNADLWCKPLVAFGDPAEQIVEKALEQGADLIVMGARHTAFTGVATHVGGGTAHKVLLEAPCPVLTIRH